MRHYRPGMNPEELVKMYLPRMVPIGTPNKDGIIITEETWYRALEDRLVKYGYEPMYLFLRVTEEGNPVDTIDLVLDAENIFFSNIGEITDYRDLYTVEVTVKRKYGPLINDLIWNKKFAVSMNTTIEFACDHLDNITQIVRPEIFASLHYEEPDDFHPFVPVMRIKEIQRFVLEPKPKEVYDVLKNSQSWDGKH